MDQLEEIKSKIDLVDYINSFVPLKKTGRNYKSPCPFHSEKTPSFVVSPERQIFKCFGCGEGGDIFKFVMKYESLDFGESLKLLADKAGVKLKNEYKKQTKTEKDPYYQINFLASEFYHYLLLKDKSGEQARNYLKQRGIKNESVEKFKLGYAPDSWEITSLFLQKKGYDLDQIKKAGFVVSKNSGRGYYDRFRDRLMFPIFDLRGNIVAFSGRTLKKEKDIPKYLNSPETIVYQKSKLLYGLFQARKEIREKQSVILSEGNIDIISAHQALHENIVAPLGTSLTQEQVKLIKRFTENVYLCFDSDFAGEKAMERGISLLEKEDMNIKVIQLEKDMDIDACLQKNPKCLTNFIENAVSIYDFYLDFALKEYSPTDPYSKKKMTSFLIPLYSKISNPVLRAHFLQKLADRVEIEKEIIFKESDKIRNFQPQKSNSEFNKNILIQKEDRTNKLSEYFLSLVLQQEEVSLLYCQDLKKEYLKGKILQNIWQKLIDYLKDEKRFLISDFYAKLEPEEVKIVDELLLQDIDFGEEDNHRKEIKKAVLGLKKVFLKNHLKILKNKIKEAESKNQETQVLELASQINQITKELL